MKLLMYQRKLNSHFSFSTLKKGGEEGEVSHHSSTTKSNIGSRFLDVKIRTKNNNTKNGDDHYLRRIIKFK